MGHKQKFETAPVTSAPGGEADVIRWKADVASLMSAYMVAGAGAPDPVPEVSDF